MANSLLDFVMSLVRDADAAQAYAADPEQAIADANLTGVTSADVDGLMPVVSESMTPMIGGAADNVWSSGAADAAFAAFDAFAGTAPVDAFGDAQRLTGNVIDQPLVVGEAAADSDNSNGGSVNESLQFDPPVLDDVPVDSSELGLDSGAFSDSVDETVEDLQSEANGFDYFG